MGQCWYVQELKTSRRFFSCKNKNLPLQKCYFNHVNFSFLFLFRVRVSHHNGTISCTVAVHIIGFLCLLSLAMDVYNISETTLSGCYKDGTRGIGFWTAGQRIDPSRKSTFVWRVTSTSDMVSVGLMSYTNWYTGQPNYFDGNQACMNILSAQAYAWHDYKCGIAMCSVCEIDI